MQTSTTVTAENDIYRTEIARLVLLATINTWTKVSIFRHMQINTWQSSKFTGTVSLRRSTKEIYWSLSEANFEVIWNTEPHN